MKYLIKILFILLTAPLFAAGQAVPIITSDSGQGIHFEHASNWQAVLAKAKEENKTIFVDFYATWCGPCKFMSNQIFTNKIVGEYFNKNFINVTVQVDKTPDDSAQIKAFYLEADSLSKVYAIQSYPCYLFISSNDVPLHRIVGATNTIQGFLNKVKGALDIDKQYYTTIKNWKGRKNDSLYMLNTLRACLDASDNENAKAIGDAYLSKFHLTVSFKNIELFSQIIHDSNSKDFNFFMNNTEKIDAIMGEGYAEHALGPVIFREQLAPLFSRKNTTLFWSKVEFDLKKKYPKMSPVLLLLEKEQFENALTKEFNDLVNNATKATVNWDLIFKALSKRFAKNDFYPLYLKRKAAYFAQKNQWTKSLKVIYVLLHNYGGQLAHSDDRELDNIAWDYVFLHSDNKKIIMEAVKWLEVIVKQKPNQANDLDTYANLLYKLGEKEQAIEWENKAIAVGKNDPANISQEDIRSFIDNLNKMVKGDPTWVISS